MSLEDHLIHSIDKRRRIEQSDGQQRKAQAPRPEIRIDPEAFKVAQELAVRRVEGAIQPDDPFFSQKENKDAHARFVEQRKRAFGKNKTPEELAVFGSAFEYLVASCINKMEWLGDHWRAQLTSEYDDYKNGVDIYLEDTSTNPEQRTPIGLALDVTFAKDEAAMKGKFVTLKEHQLEHARFSSLEYYKPIVSKKESPVLEPEKTKKSILLPKAIVGVNRDWVSAELKNFGKEENAQAVKSTIGLIFLRQIETQFDVFQEYSRKKARELTRQGLTESSQKYLDAAEKYLASYEQIKSILSEKIVALGGKPDLGRKWIEGQMEKDPVSKLIVKEIEELLA